MEYSYLLNIVKKDIEEKNENTLKGKDEPTRQVAVNLPDHLKLK
jgi:hypothetical protein